MTTEEKQLLLKDICARLPYHLKVNYADKVYDVLGYTNNRLIIALPFMSNLEGHPVETCRPYLRPMSSMTKEEFSEVKKLFGFEITTSLGKTYIDDWKRGLNEINYNIDLFDYLNKKMFDYRGLIPMGLAIPAPEGMYNN